ncbi:MAG: TonB family protein [Thermoanaerobaculia bacterium]
MFDTSLVRAHAVAAPRRITLLASLLIHSVAVVGAVALTLASTQLPANPPKQSDLYRPVDPPAIPPLPLGQRQAPRPQVTTPAKPKPVITPQQITAPAVVPDQAPESDAIPAAASDTGQAGPGPIGDPNGRRDGVDIGQAAWTGPAGPGIYTPGAAGVTSARVISRVEPRFPQALIHGVRMATVVVRCVIGKDGRIHDPEVVTSSFPPFNAAVIDALNQWTFAPGVMHGHPVDTWFELTVRFQVR